MTAVHRRVLPAIAAALGVAIAGVGSAAAVVLVVAVLGFTPAGDTMPSGTSTPDLRGVATATERPAVWPVAVPWRTKQPWPTLWIGGRS